MRKQNGLCAAIGFLLLLVSLYFGASVHNANTNSLITYLNEADHIYHYDKALVPKLNYQAALFTFPLILMIFVVEVIIAIKSKMRQVKNIGIGLSIASLIIAIVAVLILLNPTAYDFSLWGYVWITMGIFIVAGNIISIFLKGNQ